jgi:hypothetical protein
MAERSQQVGFLDHETVHWTARMRGGFIQDASGRRGAVCRSLPVPSALVSCAWRFGVDAECAEARGQILDQLWWCPVIRQREVGFSAPQHVADGLSQMPGHHPGG